MKKPVKILIGVVVLIFGLILAKDLLIKSVVKVAASKVLGAPVHIGGLSFGILNQSIRIKDFRVSNPDGFPKGILIDIPEAGVDYDLSQLMKGNLHLRTLILNLKEMNVVKNKEGKFNLSFLKVAEKKDPAAPPKNKEPQKTIPMQIDVAKLNLGKVTITDHTREPASVQTIDINVKDKTYNNIKSAQQLAILVMAESLRSSAFKNASLSGAANLLGTALAPVGAATNLLERITDKLKPAANTP
jgi:uncharacterized protein involved in outer membrane biogenesis